MLREMTMAALLCCAPAMAVARGETAQEHYDAVQTMRDEAAAMAKAQPGDAGHARAAGHLRSALAYLDRPEVRALATGDVDLYMRAVDVNRDLAAEYIALGRREEALAALEQVARYVQSPVVAHALAEMPAFGSLRDEPRFRAILAIHQAAGKTLEGEAIAPPWRETLTVEERVAGLSRFWAEARDHFVWFDHVPELDWNRAYMEALPKVMAASTTEAYYRELMKFAPLLKDGHTNIYPPRELEGRFYAVPPLTTELVGGRVLIVAVRSPGLRKLLAPGDEIVAIDGTPVRDYAERNVAPYASSSTEQDRLVRTYGYQLLAGDASRPLSLRLRNAAGVERDVRVARTGYADVENTPATRFRILPGNVAYFAIDQFETDEAVKAFEQALPAILKARGLVLDVRRNGGGSSAYGDEILSHLTRQPIPQPLSYERGGEAMLRTEAPAIAFRPLPGTVTADQGHPQGMIFSGPVVVLAGPRTFSAGEDFVAAWQQLKRGETVGMATGGSTGQPMFFDLPGGGKGRVCVKRDMRPDGTTFVGKGLQPTIEVPLTVADVRAGRDAQLERAVAALRLK